MCVHRYVMFVVCAHKHIVLDPHCISKQTHTSIYTRVHAHIFPCLSSLGSSWLTVPTPAKDYVENGGVEGLGGGQGRGDGVWGHGEGEGWGLGPLSFINLNVYTSWSLAMRPLSFPQVSPSRICCPFLHPLGASEAVKHRPRPESQARSPAW